MDAGSRVKVGQFGFSNAALNSPLFNPVRAARPTLEALNILSATDCDGMAALQPGWGNSTISDAFREAMKNWKVTTNSATNASGTAIHIALISSAPSGSGTTWTTQGDLLISEKLPWLAATGANQPPTIAGNLSQETTSAIQKLINVAPIIATASAGTTEAQSLVTGEESHAVRFERGVASLLADGEWAAGTTRLEATFGAFGSLPIVMVAFTDAFVLLDSVNGSLDGPFAPGSDLDSTALLQSHVDAYQPGTRVRFATQDGCIVTGASTTRPGTPPAGYIPSTPSPVVTPPPLPGNPSNWTCVTLGTGPTLRCECIMTESWTFSPPPTPPPPYGPPNNNRIRVKHTCTYAGGACGTPAAFPPSSGTPSPGSSPPVPGPTNGLPPVTPTCIAEHYTW